MNPYLDSDIEECHIEMWKELNKNYPELLSTIESSEDTSISVGSDKYFDEKTGKYNYTDFKEVEAPPFISYKQYLHAEQHGCRTCRKFVKEYDKLISHSVFVHLFDFRYYLKLLLNELNCIRDSLLYDFGVEYEDESQEQTATLYYSWAKMAENHTRIIAEELSKQADELPASEVDQISEKQAAQFQAFFSIRVSAYTETIDNLLFSLKRHLEDTCEIFYKKHVSPSIKFRSKVASPLELDLSTSSMTRNLPKLSQEVVTAVNAFKGNFGAILTDMVQRRNSIESKFDKLLSLNIQRRKYINYIDQLSNKSSSRPKVHLEVKEDKYTKIFDTIIINPNDRESLSSTHSNLDDLQENSHPQYLLRSGGTIFGDLLFENGATVDGVDISEHRHSGSDGSQKIRSTDIDYESGKNEISLLSDSDGNFLMDVSIESFSSDIRIGGVPVIDAVLAISVPDEYADKYEYEIMYTEIK